MSKHIFSTLANDNRYVQWQKGAGDLKIPGRSVLVNGGTGVANDRFITPLGIHTEVSDEDYKILDADPGFLAHKAAGFIIVQDKKADAEKVAADMSLADPSAPLTSASPQLQNTPATAEA